MGQQLGFEGFDGLAESRECPHRVFSWAMRVRGMRCSIEGLERERGFRWPRIERIQRAPFLVAGELSKAVFGGRWSGEPRRVDISR